MMKALLQSPMLPAPQRLNVGTSFVTRKAMPMNQAARKGKFADIPGPWEERLALIVDTMREMSRQTDPQAMVRAYRARVRQIMPADRSLSLSRRDLTAPLYRITRSSTWA